MYRLMVKNPVTDKWEQIEIIDTTIAINKQRNDIAELKDRQSDYSQQINIPRIEKNCKFFGFIDNFSTKSVLRHRLYDCRLYSNGIEIAGYGSKLKINRIGEYFECQILGSNYGFFYKLTDGDKTINDLDIQDSTIRNSYSILTCEKTDTIVWGICDFQKEYESVESFNKSDLKLVANRVYPFIKLKKIIDKILYENGRYTLNSNIADDYEYVNAIIPFAKMNPKNYGISNSYIEYKFQHTINVTIELWQNSALYNKSGFFKVPDEDNDPHKNYMFEYDVKFSGKYTFTPNINLITSTDTSISTYFKIFIDDVEILSKESIIEDGIQKLKVTEPITLQLTGDSVVKFKVYANLIYAREYFVNNLGVTISDYVSDSDNTEFSWGYEIKAQGNLPEIKQVDFFKNFLQMFGLTCDVDERNKIVYAHTFKKINDNKSIAKDWTYKLNAGINTVENQIGDYGKINTLSYATETYNDNEITDKSSFNIDDDTLKSKNDFITLLFESVENLNTNDLTGVNFNYAKIKWLTGNKHDGTINPKICILSDSKKNIYQLYTDIEGEVITEYPELYSIASIDNDISLNSYPNLTAYNLISKYYDILINKVLNDVRYIQDAEFYLTELDVNEYSPFIPVYLQQYGCFFYVNKIKNFISNQLTKVDLIKI